MANGTEPGSFKFLPTEIHSRVLQFVHTANQSVNRFCRPPIRYWQRLRRYGPWKAIATAPDNTIYARAYPERISLIERYAYEQEISNNPQPGSSIAPTGIVKVRVPYDGAQCFTRMAWDDVQRGEEILGGDTIDTCRIGHLVIKDPEQRTNLGSLLDLSEHHGALPLEMPIKGPSLPDGHLISDQHAYLWQQDYIPQVPKVRPIDVTLRLLDEEELETLALSNVENLRNRLTKHTEFGPSLRLFIQINVNLPEWLQCGKNLKIRRVALSWPTIPPLGSFKVQLPGGRPPVPFKYNLATRNLEWSNLSVPVHPVQDAAAGVRGFLADPFILEIYVPSELHGEERLNAEVEVEVFGLLSGLGIRLYDATGPRSSHPAVFSRSRLSMRSRLFLDDAFSSRVHSPYQQLHFDEVVPEEMRIRDIVGVLNNEGFVIEKDEPISNDSDLMEHIIRCSRREGPHRMELLVFIVGQRHRTQRRTQGGGSLYISDVSSGDIKVFVHGTLPAGGHQLLEQMNRLHAALRERFEPLRARK